MRATLSVWIFAALTITAAAQHPHDPDTTVKGGGKLPAGWHARLDTDAAKLDAVVVTEEKGALTFTTGPAGIYYKPSMKGSGDYQVAGTFSQLKPSAHPEAYGIFVGGTDLDKPTQRYTYFLVRQDGKYLIKSRDGSATKPIVDWTAAPPMKDAAPTAERAKTSNELTVRVQGDTVSFLIGGTEVKSLPRAQVTPDGIAGLRINHNLNVQVTGFDLKK